MRMSESMLNGTIEYNKIRRMLETSVPTWAVFDSWYLVIFDRLIVLDGIGAAPTPPKRKISTFSRVHVG